jgi:hypothetical protein
MSQLIIMGASFGDKRVTWTADNPESVKRAKKRFDDLMAQDIFTAFSIKIDKNGKKQKSRMIKRFNPKAGEVILVPQVAGG